MELSPTHAKHVRDISLTLRLRKPQADSLELLARIAAVVPLSKEAQVLAKAVEDVKRVLPKGHTFESFERDFPSLAFTLATGVGKTRLMGAFVVYLHRAHGIRHFFVLAPNLTIYDKLRADFSAGSRKYVFRGIDEFSATAPTIVTGEDYDKVANTLFSGTDESVHINVFNQQKLKADNTDTTKNKRKVKARLRRLSEFIGQSYFDYLKGLDKLVVLMDESHRYRAEKIMDVLNELRPVLGLELTATPQVEKKNKTVPFKNVVYRYPLANAIQDGFVKRPAVGTRDGFDAAGFTRKRTGESQAARRDPVPREHQGGPRYVHAPKAAAARQTVCAGGVERHNPRQPARHVPAERRVLRRALRRRGAGPRGALQERRRLRGAAAGHRAAR